MTKEVKEKIGHFLGLLINLCIALISIVILIMENLRVLGINQSDAEPLIWVLFLIATYPAWRWRAKPIQFLIWCCKSFYQKL